MKTTLPTPLPVETVYARLREWYRQIPGRLVLQAERGQLDALLPSLPGNRIVQIGCLGESALLACSQIPHRIVVDPGVNASDVGPDLYACADALPFDTESLDVLVLPHTLEFEGDPHGVLREVNRVLAPEGHLVIIGFNPWGLWGLWRMFWKRRGEPPWCGCFLGLSRLYDWLSLLDFREVHTRYFFFRPPLQREALMRTLTFLEVPGGRWWLPISGLYLVVAQKRVATMTPIRLRWPKVYSRAPNLCWVEPTASEVGHGQ
ncbi:Methyltransf_11 domain-containing protein [Gammaproteobacteria bacterium]